MRRGSAHTVREQLPAWLARLEDRRGFTWRISNAVRRFSARRAVTFVKAYARPYPYRRPILIVGMPRSGTTLLFEVLRLGSGIASRDTEGHDVWRRYHHPRRTGWHSDLVGRGEVGRGEPRFVSAHFYAHAGAGRLLDKTADNVVRVPYLLDLFPDACFIVITRSPCDVLNSYLNMWRHPRGRFRSYFVPDALRIPGYPHRHMWCSTLIEGWRELATASIPEIAFAQWSQYVRCIAEARRTVPGEQWAEIHFEDLLTSPTETLARLTERIGLDVNPEMAETLRTLVARPVNAMSSDGQGSWRRQNPEDVGALLSRIPEPARVLGYVVDPVSGEVALDRPGPSSSQSDPR